MLGEERLRAPALARPRRPDRRRRRARCAAATARSRCASTDFQLLAKALRPPPDKHHGLTDVETRYRHRELDLIANEDARRLFVDRARIVAAVRAYLDGEGFVEVETPVLQPLYGGALARPFTTHHNALDRDLYLRIATELYLKRLIVGGLERVYELGKDFRNEGVSHQAQPRVHDGRVVRGLRRLRATRPRAWKSSCAGAARASATQGELDFDAAVAARQLRARRSREATGIDLREHARRAEALRRRDRASGGSTMPTEGVTWPQLADDLLSKYVEPTLRSRPSSSTTRSSSRRSRASTAPSRAWSSAGRRSPAAWRSPTPSAS